MSISGKKVVIGFYGTMGLLALLGFGIVLLVRMQPVVQQDQRALARLIPNAYQKYRYDNNAWPRDAYDAALGFTSETPELPARVKKAEAEWGLKAEMVDPEGSAPEVRVTFQKPSPLEMKFSLYRSKKH